VPWRRRRLNFSRLSRRKHRLRDTEIDQALAFGIVHVSDPIIKRDTDDMRLSKIFDFQWFLLWGLKKAREPGYARSPALFLGGV